VAGFGALSTALGIGSFVGALLAAYNHNLSIKRLFIGAGLFSLCLGVLSMTNTLLLSELVLIGMGLTGVIFTTTANTLLQKQSSDEMRGRVMSLYVLLFIGTTPIGAFVTGSLASTIGVEATLVLEASLCVVGLIGAGLFYWLKTNTKVLSQ
jgi:predicted MFS family arabinose efflux permease